ncbi:MAG: acyl-CoA dehydrogenase family protein [Steroidobacteraceae bacterium]
MDFSIDDRTQELVARYRDFIDERLLPLEPIFLQQGVVPLEAALAEVREEARKRGLWGPNYPVEEGGQGLDLVTHGLVSEVLGRSPLGHYSVGVNAPDAGNAELMHLHGSPKQREEWMSPLMRGDIRTCFGMTERDNSGANPLMMETRATLEKDQWVINGSKWFTTGADGAALCIVMAVTDPEAPPHKRASLLLVPANTPGYVVERKTPIMGHEGHGLFSHAEIAFRDCKVPADSLLGERGGGFALAQARLGPGRIHHCMRWLGICQRALEMMMERANQRAITPDGRPLGDSDLIRSWVAECAAEIQAARLLVLHTAWRIVRAGARAARNDVSMIKYYVADVLQRVLDRALQVHGGLGMTDYTVLAFYYREERAARIYDGPDEVHKLSVARRLLSGREG